jgi:hypothetical protein
MVSLLDRIVNYMFTDSHERLALCAYWICVIYVSVRRFYSISKQSKTERILLRKYYHLVAVLIFSPAVIFQVLWLSSVFITEKKIFPFPSLYSVICSAKTFCSLVSWTWHLAQHFQFS